MPGRDGRRERVNLLRYDGAGTLVEQLDVPDDFVSSCCSWPGSRRMLITTGTSVFFHQLG